jgi:hypothetical protein
MQNLQILTDNNLGTMFWEQRTGMADAIEFNSLNFSAFKNIIDSQNEFILVDFYHNKFSMEQEQELILKFCEYGRQVSGFLKLFILSPTYAGSKLESIEMGNSTIIIHNYTAHFLRTLSSTGKKFIFINQ